MQTGRLCRSGRDIHCGPQSNLGILTDPPSAKRKVTFSITFRRFFPRMPSRLVPQSRCRLQAARDLYIKTHTVRTYRSCHGRPYPRQRQVLRFIQEALAEHGMPPTRAEIAEALGFKSANAAEEHLRALQRKGVIDLRPGASRGIQLRDSLREQMGLPLIGRVAAGRPILAEENIEAHYQIDRTCSSRARTTCSRCAA